MALKVKIGNVVRGESEFFERKLIMKNLKNKVMSNSHILISAPRRVGKTSLMYYLKDNPYDGYCVIYVITESVYDEKDFFKRLYEETAKEVYSKGKKIFKNAYQLLSSQMLKFNINIAGNKIDFEKGINNIDYNNEFKKLIDDIKSDTKLIIMIDEFAQAVENIKKYGGKIEAEKFLQLNREIRQVSGLDNNVIFIYAGSIGLENLVEAMGCINVINDLDNLVMEPLSRKEGEKFVNELIEGLDIQISNNIIRYLLDRIEWLIPYYIQLIINEITQVCSHKETCEVSEALIDEAINKLLKNNNYFGHWYKRLNKVFTDEKKYKFTIELLNTISLNNEILKSDVSSISSNYQLGHEYIEIINSLEYDGYLVCCDNKYVFNSPILRMWWCKNVSI